MNWYYEQFSDLGLKLPSADLVRFLNSHKIADDFRIVAMPNGFLTLIYRELPAKSTHPASGSKGSGRG